MGKEKQDRAETFLVMKTTQNHRVCFYKKCLGICKPDSVFKVKFIFKWSLKSSKSDVYRTAPDLKFRASSPLRSRIAAGRIASFDFSQDLQPCGFRRFTPDFHRDSSLLLWLAVARSGLRRTPCLLLSGLSSLLRPAERDFAGLPFSLPDTYIIRSSTRREVFETAGGKNFGSDDLNNGKSRDS